MEMESMVHSLLARFEGAYPGHAPPSLAFYRDGVSDGEWEQVLNKEVPAIRSTCEKIKKENPGTLGANGWDPKVSCMGRSSRAR